MDIIDNKLSEYQSVKNGLEFKDKVVLVTGSGSGIGAETVRLFSYLGANVVVTDKTEEAVKRVADECHQLSPDKLKVKFINTDKLGV